MREILPDIHARGARLVVVGNGKPFHARGFLEDYPIDALVLVDPDLKAYAAAGLRRGKAITLGFAAIRNGLRAFKKGFRQTSVKGDPWQQGGVFVVRKDGEVVYSHISQAAGDHPEPRELLEAVGQAG